MLKNNIRTDIKIKCIEADTTQEKVAERIGTTGQYISRVIQKGDGVINRTFVKLVEALGYDIEIHYVKRSDEK